MHMFSCEVVLIRQLSLARWRWLVCVQSQSRYYTYVQLSLRAFLTTSSNNNNCIIVNCCNSYIWDLANDNDPILLHEWSELSYILISAVDVLSLWFHPPTITGGDEPETKAINMWGTVFSLVHLEDVALLYCVSNDAVILATGNLDTFLSFSIYNTASYHNPLWAGNHWIWWG